MGTVHGVAKRWTQLRGRGSEGNKVKGDRKEQSSYMNFNKGRISVKGVTLQEWNITPRKGGMEGNRPPQLASKH